MGMQVQEMRQESISNNLANVNTVGFKRHVLAFSADHWAVMGRLNDKFTKTPLSRRDDRPAIGFARGGAILSRETQEWLEGPLNITGNPLDVALREPQMQHNPVPGENYRVQVHMFKVADKEGNSFFTKNGEFQINEEGFLITRDGGHYVLFRDPESGRESPRKLTMHRDGDEWNGQYSRGFDRDQIQADSSGRAFQYLTGQVVIDDAGFVSLSDERPEVPVEFQRNPIGFLAISKVPIDGLVEKGRNVYGLTNDPLNPADPNSKPVETPVNLLAADEFCTVRSGALEQSNVSSVKELVALLACNRLYEMNARCVKAQDELLGRSVQEVGRSVR